MQFILIAEFDFLFSQKSLRMISRTKWVRFLKDLNDVFANDKSAVLV